MARRIRRLVAGLPGYVRIAWWGLVAPRVSEQGQLVVAQAAVFSESGVLLTVRGDLHGWELPGGNLMPGESPSAAVVREVREETGLDVEIVRKVGDYIRTGFRPHCASIFECRVVGGELRPSRETPVVRWFDSERLPDTLFPWYRAPLADAAIRRKEPVTRHEHQGIAAIWAGLLIDLRMRWTNDQAGLHQQRERPST